MDTRELRRKFYYFSYRIRDLFWLFTFAVIIVIAGPLIFGKVLNPDILKPFETLDGIIQYVLGLWVILALIWLAFPTWSRLTCFSIRFKTLFWLFTFIIVAIIIGTIILNKVLSPDILKPFETLDGIIQYVLGLWVILALIWLAFPAWFNMKYFSLRLKTIFWLFTFVGVIIVGPIILNNVLGFDTLKPFESLKGMIQYILFGLWIILAIIWLAFPAWFSLRFRYLALWISHGGGFIISWLFSGWRPAALLLIGVCTVLGAREIIIDNTIDKTANYTINSPQYGLNNLTTTDFWTKDFNNTWTNFLMPDFWLKIFAISTLLVLIYWAYQSRKCIVIPQFTNQTGDDKLKSIAEGISSVLLNELERLVNLYRMVDDSDPYNPPSQGAEVSISPNINVSGVGETLKSAVTSDSKVKLGILEVPIGAIMGVLGMAVEGPQLTGSLHKEGESLILIAKISGGGLKGDWRVSSSDLPKKDVLSGDPLSRMIRQLAYRIFTDLEQVRLGSPRWKAICHYTDGLRAYRETLRTDRDKMPQLRRAEKAFLMALGEDTKFLKCYYNLGVVYRALKQPESAFSVLNKSVDPYQPESYLSKVYYAQAQNHSWIQTQKKDAIKKMEKMGLEEPGYKFTLQDTDYKSTLQLCDLALRLQPEDAKAWDLMGMMKRRMMEQELLYKPLNQLDYWRTEIIPVREIATALAWRNLCFCALKGKVDKSSKNIATTCTRNLAVAYSQANPAYGKPFFDQAIHLAPTDAELHIELGKILDSTKMWQEAAKSFENALIIKQRPLFWGYLALVNAKLYNREINRNVLKITSKLKSYNGATNPTEFRDHPLNAVAYLTRKYFLESVQNYKRSSLSACQHTMDNANGLDEDSLEQAKNAMNTLISCLSSRLDKKSNESDMDYKMRLEELKSEQSDWDWGYARVLLQILDNESDRDKAKEILKEAAKRLERDASPQMARISDLLSQLTKKEGEADTDYKKRLEDLKQKLFDWDWGYAQILLQLRASESDQYKSEEMLKEAKKRLDKDSSPRMAVISDLLIQLNKKKDNADLELSVPTPNSLPIADCIDLFDTVIDYKKSLEDLKQKYFDCDWGYVRILLQLLAIESDNDKVDGILKEAKSRLEKGGAPRMAMVSDLLSQLDNRKDETNADYKKRLEDLKQKLFDWDWGYAQVLLELAAIENNINKKSEILKDSIVNLEKYHPQEIINRGIHGWLANILIEQKNFHESLYHAQCSVALKPERSWDRGVLSKVHQSYENIEEASSHLRACMSLEPLNHQFLREFAYSQFGLTPGIKNREEWKKSLYKYIEILNKSLELLESELLDEKTSESKIFDRGWTHYRIGTAHYLLNDYDKAIYHLTIAKNLSRGSQGQSDLFTKLSLGEAYLNNNSFIEAEYLLNELIADILNLLQTKGVLEYINPMFTSEKHTLGSLLVYAYLYLAFSYAERDAIHEALKRLKDTKEYIKYLGDSPENVELEAMYADRKGWIFYKQVKLGDGTSDIKEAIDSLEEAICKRAEPEYYLHLALALEYLLEAKEDKTKSQNLGKADFQRYMHRALACCDHVIDLDLQEKYTEKAKELKKRLQDLKGDHPKAATASEATKQEQDLSQGYA